MNDRLDTVFYYFVRVTIGLLALIAFSNGPGGRATAASPHDQAYLACANGYEGNAGDCARLCRLFLKQANNPLGDMKATCITRVKGSRSKGIPEPD